MILLSGKEPSLQILQQVRERTLSYSHLNKPGLATILVGDDPASQTYVQSKKKKALECGFADFHHKLDHNVSLEKLLSLIKQCNDNPDIHGILVQQPLPPHIDTQIIIEAIDWKKDVDGFHPYNVGLLSQGFTDAAIIPCTPWGVIKLLQFYNYKTTGKHVVIVGRSNIVGRPLSLLLSASNSFGNATVTLAHSKTENLPQLCKTADLLIAAVGQPNLITKEWVKPGAWVIDVGINRVPVLGDSPPNKLCGDVDFDQVSTVADALTPVPGGVGLMTVAILMANTLRCFEKQNISQIVDKSVC